MGNGALSDFKSSIIAEDTSAGKIGPTAAFVVQSLLVLHSRLSHSLVDGPRSPVKVSIFQPSANLVSPRLTENRGAGKGKGGKKREEEGENENGKRDRTGRVESDEAIPRTSRQLARGNTCVNFAPFDSIFIGRASTNQENIRMEILEKFYPCVEILLLISHYLFVQYLFLIQHILGKSRDGDFGKIL